MVKVDVKYTKLFINNEWVDAVSKKTFPTINPQNETVIIQVAEADKADVDLAVAAAKKAFHRYSEWRTMDASQRGILMLKLADLMESQARYLAELETLDCGKPVKVAEGEVYFAASVLRYYAGKADKILGNTIPAGCTIVLKPAEQTPLTALAVAALTKEAGFPPGVVNVLPGYGPTAGAAITHHPDVDKVAFTGSTEVGRMIMGAASVANLKRVTLELGGKSPLVVFNDADVEKAAQIAHATAFENAGQCCCAGTRTYVQAGIYDQFVSKAAEIAKKRSVGNPFDDVQQGPQIDKEMYTKVLDYIKAGKESGARCVAGGDRAADIGYYVQPTVFADVQDDMKIAREEIFGPVQSIFKFETFDEAVDRANDTNYGLGAGVITNDITTAMAFARHVRAGSVWINIYDHVTSQTPFGGFKDSGMGRELGEEGINNYLEVKTITMSLPKRPLL
ncbi:Aldehyde dehydrogenase X, mitochondrial [Papilio xuthus]|uniref:Aldehyde dehydrogenase X, mitochondrial n=1 Tax=Papilio xuthus TaxID=66420 RepID=A0A194PH46_PAPXU|nr:Aldehyde dehydrogenase X, mitochondrial [Papilio xuthus]